MDRREGGGGGGREREAEVSRRGRQRKRSHRMSSHRGRVPRWGWQWALAESALRKGKRRCIKNYFSEPQV